MTVIMLQLYQVPYPMCNAQKSAFSSGEYFFSLKTASYATDF